MYRSKCIPVNVNRKNCVVYTSSKAFDVEHLKSAYAFLTGNEVSGVYLEDGCIKFNDAPNISWMLDEVYIAYDAYSQAVKNNFSFYMVKNSEGTPQLFISKPFHGCRILVNSFTMKTVLLKKKKLVSKAASLIDKTMEFPECMNLFNTLSDYENDRGNYLSGLICYKGTSKECMMVNPMITLMSDVVNTYYPEVIDEMRKILKDPESSTMFEMQHNHVVRVSPVEWDPMPVDFVKEIIELYDNLIEKKSNYMEIVDTEYNTRLLFSTNSRYLVNASTFECVVIKNQHTKDLLNQMVNNGPVRFDQISLIWMLAQRE